MPAAAKPPEEEADPTHPQYLHGLNAGLDSLQQAPQTGGIATLPRAPGATALGTAPSSTAPRSPVIPQLSPTARTANSSVAGAQPPVAPPTVSDSSGAATLPRPPTFTSTGQSQTGPLTPGYGFQSAPQQFEAAGKFNPGYIPTFGPMTDATIGGKKVPGQALGRYPLDWLSEKQQRSMFGFVPPNQPRG